MITKSAIDIFKPHVSPTNQYVGGITREESKSAQAEKLYKLSSNENLLGPSPKALEAIKANLHLLHEYSFQSDQLFRKALAEHHDHQMDARQFITANAGMELLELVARGFIEPGLETIVFTPTFKALENFAKLQGSKIVKIPLLEPDFKLDLQGVLDAVNDKTRLLFLPNPNNPTGSLIPKKTADDLIYNLPDHVVTIYDEVYFPYVQSPNYARALDYINAGRRVIGLHSFSKAYGLAGIRLAYAFSTPEISEYLSALRRPFMINTLSMVAGMAALQDEEHLQATIDLVNREKPWLYAQLEKRGIHYWPSESNFILFKSPFANEFFIPQMLNAGVMIRPGEDFGLPGTCRVTIGTREANEAFVLNCYKSAINA
jgi:histidinol-phosphate aminotransferase